MLCREKEGNETHAGSSWELDPRPSALHATSPHNNVNSNDSSDLFPARAIMIL